MTIFDYCRRRTDWRWPEIDDFHRGGIIPFWLRPQKDRTCFLGSRSSASQWFRRDESSALAFSLLSFLISRFPKVLLKVSWSVLKSHILVLVERKYIFFSFSFLQWRHTGLQSGRRLKTNCGWKYQTCPSASRKYATTRTLSTEFWSLPPRWWRKLTQLLRWKTLSHKFCTSVVWMGSELVSNGWGGDKKTIQGSWPCVNKHLQIHKKHVNMLCFIERLI